MALDGRNRTGMLRVIRAQRGPAALVVEAAIRT